MTEDEIVDEMKVLLSEFKRGIDLISESLARETTYFNELSPKLLGLAPGSLSKAQQKELFSDLIGHYQREYQSRELGNAIVMSTTQRLMQLIELGDFAGAGKLTE